MDQSPIDEGAYYVRVKPGERVAIDIGGIGLNVTILDSKKRIAKIEYGVFGERAGSDEVPSTFQPVAYDAVSIRATAVFKVDAVRSVKVERRG